jgi:hypothetical protein
VESEAYQTRGSGTGQAGVEADRERKMAPVRKPSQSRRHIGVSKRFPKSEGWGKTMGDPIDGQFEQFEKFELSPPVPRRRQ